MLCCAIVADISDQGCIKRLVTLDALQCTCRLLRQIEKHYDVTDYRCESDVIFGIYLSILGDDIFRKLERIESNPAYSTTLELAHLSLQCGVNKFKPPNCKAGDHFQIYNNKYKLPLERLL